MTVAEAKAARVCRICHQPIGGGHGAPEGWTECFDRQVVPERITLHFGAEFAHTACLEAEAQA